MKTIEDEVKSKVKSFQNLESKFLVLQSNLSKNTEFRQFLKLQKAVAEKNAEMRAQIQEIMIKNDKDQIDAGYVLLTIVKKKKLVIDEDMLNEEYTKIVPDTTKINDFIKKEKRMPNGVIQVPNPYLRIDFRPVVS